MRTHIIYIGFGSVKGASGDTLCTLKKKLYDLTDSYKDNSGRFPRFWKWSVMEVRRTFLMKIIVNNF